MIYRFIYLSINFSGTIPGADPEGELGGPGPTQNFQKQSF